MGHPALPVVSAFLSSGAEMLSF